MQDNFSLKYISDLACLSLEESELDSLTEDMKSIIELMDTIKQIDTADIPITEHVSGASGNLRDDIAQISQKSDDVLSNAAIKIDNCFVVPKLIE